MTSSISRPASRCSIYELGVFAGLVTGLVPACTRYGASTQATILAPESVPVYVVPRRVWDIEGVAALEDPQRRKRYDWGKTPVTRALVEGNYVLVATCGGGESFEEVVLIRMGQPNQFPICQ